MFHNWDDANLTDAEVDAMKAEIEAWKKRALEAENELLSKRADLDAMTRHKDAAVENAFKVIDGLRAEIKRLTAIISGMHASDELSRFDLGS